RHPDHPVAQLHRRGRQVVSPGIEGSAAGEIEAGMVPVAGQNSVLDRTAVQREAEMRAAIVDRKYAPPFMNDEQRAVLAPHDNTSVGPDLVERGDADEAVVGRGTGFGHGRFLSSPRVTAYHACETGVTGLS